MVAIVTGGGNGIGKACCMKLAQHGIKVVIADIDGEAAEQTAEEIRLMGQEASSFYVNLVNVSEIKEMVVFAAERYGGISILVNNAGILQTTEIENITETEWDQISDINLKAMFFACQAVLPYMKKNQYGRIVNMSSVAGRNGGFANGLAYSVTKAGVIGLSKGLATRLAKDNINVNTVCPGTTKTPILDGFTEEKVCELIEKIPLKKLGEVGDIANLVYFLCSEESSFITGATIDINGGMYIGS